MSYSDTLENELLDHWMDDGSYTASTTLHAALSTSTPSDDGSNFTEPGSNYARVDVSSDSLWDAAAAGVKDNASAITFVQASGSWGTVTHFGLYTASTSGTMLAFGALTASRVIDSGETAEFAAGAFDITLD